MRKLSIEVRWSHEDEEYVAVCPGLGGLYATGAIAREAVTELELLMYAEDVAEEAGIPFESYLAIIDEHGAYAQHTEAICRWRCEDDGE
jgi:hypothetical protein